MTPLKYTHTTYCLQISHQETQPLVRPTATAFDKVQVQQNHGQLGHDKIVTGETGETYVDIFEEIKNTCKLFLF